MLGLLYALIHWNAFCFPPFGMMRFGALSASTFRYACYCYRFIAVCSSVGGVARTTFVNPDQHCSFREVRYAGRALCEPVMTALSHRLTYMPAVASVITTTAATSTASLCRMGPTFIGSMLMLEALIQVATRIRSAAMLDRDKTAPRWSSCRPSISCISSLSILEATKVSIVFILGFRYLAIFLC